MTQPKGKLCGIVETDQTYIGGVRKTTSWAKAKVPVNGIVARGGKVKAVALNDLTGYSVIPYVERNVRRGSTLYTDGAHIYKELEKNRFKRGRVYHGAREYVRGPIHTNTIEGFWSGLKNNIRTTYRGVSKHKLQNYIDEATFYWNASSPFSELVSKL